MKDKSNEMGSRHYSEDQSMEQDEAALVRHHEAHELHHRQLEERLRSEFQKKVDEARTQLGRERELFQDVLKTILSSFSQEEGGIWEDSFGDKFEAAKGALVDKVTGVFRDKHFAEQTEDHLNSLGEHLYTLQAKLRGHQDKERQLERSLRDAAGASSSRHQHKGGRSGESPEKESEIFSEREEKSIQERHSQLNDPNDLGRLAEERNYSLQTALKEVEVDFRRELDTKRAYMDEQVSQNYRKLTSALAQFHQSHWRGALSVLSGHADPDIEHAAPKVVFETSDFQLLLRCLELHQQILAQKGSRGRTAGNFGGQLLNPEAMSQAVQGLFKKKEGSGDTPGADLATHLPAFESIVGVFVDTVIREMEESGLLQDHSVDAQEVRRQLLSLQTFSADFAIHLGVVHSVYLAGLEGCSRVASSLIEAALESSQKLATLDPSCNYFIRDLKALHAQVVAVFGDKKHKALRVEGGLVTLEARTAHLRELVGDFDDFAERVEAGTRALSAKAANS